MLFRFHFVKRAEEIRWQDIISRSSVAWKQSISRPWEFAKSQVRDYSVMIGIEVTWLCYSILILLYNTISNRDHSVYGPSQWEMTLQCSVVSHWLSPYAGLSLANCGSYWLCFKGFWLYYKMIHCTCKLPEIRTIRQFLKCQNEI